MDDGEYKEQHEMSAIGATSQSYTAMPCARPVPAAFTIVTLPHPDLHLAPSLRIVANLISSLHPVVIVPPTLHIDTVVILLLLPSDSPLCLRPPLSPSATHLADEAGRT